MDERTYRTEPFNQEGLLSAKKNPASAGGACHLFALKWLSEIIKEKSRGPLDRIQKLKFWAKEVKVLYAAFSKRWTREGNIGADQGVGRMLEVDINDPQDLNSFEQVANVVCKSQRAGFVYSFWFSKGGAHSIGVYRSGGTWGGHIYVLEPNFGEYKMDKSQFETWLSGFIGPKYDDFGIVTEHQLREVHTYKAKAPKFGAKV